MINKERLDNERVAEGALGVCDRWGFWIRLGERKRGRGNGGGADSASLEWRVGMRRVWSRPIAGPLNVFTPVCAVDEFRGCFRESGNIDSADQMLGQSVSNMECTKRKEKGKKMGSYDRK